MIILTLNEVITEYKNQLGVILEDYIGNFIFSDGNVTKALVSLPDEEYGLYYPPSGTTLQDSKIGVALMMGSQPLQLGLNHTDIKIKVSVFTNQDILLLFQCWELLNVSTLPIIGQPEIKQGKLDPVAKNFLFFNLLNSI